MRILSVVGARPNFMKVAPIHEELLRRDLDARLVHTGQHYDRQMSDVFFRQLGLPEPDAYLGVGSGSHAQQTARVMTEFEPVLLDMAPDLVLTVGDVNSTLACSLVANKLGTPVAHVEAGLRSFDRRMPEEINRILTDQLSDFLFVTEASGLANLRAEGIDGAKVHFVGNVMIDTLVRLQPAAARLSILDDLGLTGQPYALATLHRPSNVDSLENATSLAAILDELAGHLRVVFPIHPRTRASFQRFGLLESITDAPAITLLEPLGYLEFLALMRSAAVVVTDSGGIQEETTFLGVPCLTLRENTERPVTIEMGTNELWPLDPAAISARVRALLQAGSRPEHSPPPLWDGRAAERIVQVFLDSGMGSEAP